MRDIKKKACLGTAAALFAAALTTTFLGASHIIAGLLFVGAFFAIMFGMDMKSEPKPEAKPEEKAKAKPEEKAASVPLTPENLETLMPGTTGLSNRDSEQLDALIAEARERILRNRENRREVAPERSAEEIRERLLAYGPLPVAPAQKDDPECVPLDIFSFKGKNDPEKITEMLKNLEEVAFPAYPSKIAPPHPSRPMVRKNGRGPEERMTPEQLADQFGRMADRTKDPELKKTLQRLANSAQEEVKEVSDEQ